MLKLTKKKDLPTAIQISTEWQKDVKLNLVMIKQKDYLE